MIKLCRTRTIKPLFFTIVFGFWALGLFHFISLPGVMAAEDPKLYLKSPSKTITFSRSQLLARKDAVRVEVPDDATYQGRKMVYTAVPIRNLFKDLPIADDATLLFRCLDGYSAPISKDRLLSEKGSIAYLAIEKPKEKWGPVHPPTQMESAGPFYIIWKNPKELDISKEEWPFQLSGFEVQNSMAVTYPAIFPNKSVAADSAITRGFQQFTKNCFTCHSMNLQGNMNVGPDLNIPMNPTEYYSEKILKKLIRDPRSLRKWPTAKMYGFGEETISEDGLNDLIAYLKHMADQKVK
jgi:mono/diheme cytochrome c family protein